MQRVAEGLSEEFRQQLMVKRMNPPSCLGAVEPLSFGPGRGEGEVGGRGGDPLVLRLALTCLSGFWFLVVHLWRPAGPILFFQNYSDGRPRGLYK